MRLYLYAIAEPGAEAPGARGVGGGEVRMVEAERLAAAVSELDPRFERLEEADMWAHEDVVEGLMETGPVLPMRLGTVLEGEDAVRAVLRQGSDRLEAGLERVRGAVELAVRAVLVAPEAAPTEGERTGTDYMLSRVDLQRQADELARRVHEPLAALARASTFQGAGVADRQARGAYLVDQEGVEGFRARVEELERERVASALVCTGPWPPYSFSDVRSDS